MISNNMIWYVFAPPQSLQCICMKKMIQKFKPRLSIMMVSKDSVPYGENLRIVYAEKHVTINVKLPYNIM